MKKSNKKSGAFEHSLLENAQHRSTNIKKLKVKRNFFYSGAKAWNEIPLQIRMCSNITTFKKRSKEFLQI